MSTLSHAAVGFLIARYFVHQGWVPDATTAPFIVSVISANLPDLDGLMSLKDLTHHQSRFKSIFHLPINWVLLCILVAGILYQLQIPYALPYVALVLTNILGHFFLDTFSIYGGIAWLAPWKKRKFSFIQNLDMLPGNNKELINWYLKHWVIYLEIALWIITLIIVLAVPTASS